MTPLRIAAYLRPRGLRQPTGVGKHAINMLREMAGRPDVTLSLLAAGRDLDESGIPEDAGLGRIPVARLPLSARTLEWLWTYAGRPAADTAVPDADWVYCPIEACPPVCRAQLAVTVHCVNWFDPDLPWHGAWSTRRSRLRLRPVFGRMVRRADVIFAVSEFLKGRLCALFDVDPGRVVVVGNGVEEAYFARGIGGSAPAEPPYVVVVGPVQERKGSGHVFAVADELRAMGSPIRIRIACGRAVSPPYTDEAPRHPNVELLDYQGLDTLPGLVAGSVALLCLSRYETFGIPVAEAMAAGVPAVVADDAALPETAGDAGLIVSAREPRAVAERIEQLRTDAALRRRIIEAGRRRAERFHWRGCADRVVAALRERTSR